MNIVRRSVGKGVQRGFWGVNTPVQRVALLQAPTLMRYFSAAAGESEFSPYIEGKHRSNAESLVNSVPPIEVDGHVAVCDGGGGALGHPLEYLQLDTVDGSPTVCKYCGLRYVKKQGGH
jgi:uncharacterized Zn-finger protein